ncbi:MAG: hypothetical protein KIS61_00260 [Candidatus Eremiobacteraeota bacterium]|jgi:hypothetical protein|nr:hypothetical protein [Candidatus Eremiobacteraeota bacterium]
MAQEVLVARCSLLKDKEDQEIKMMLKEAVERLYPDFVTEVRRELVKFPTGAPVNYYWQDLADLEKDKLGVIAWKKN